MKQLVTKIKSWFKDRNDRKDRDFLERTRIKMENHEDGGSTTELPNNQAEKMRELAGKKRNNKPFYKDDKAKDWEQ